MSIDEIAVSGSKSVERACLCAYAYTCNIIHIHDTWTYNLIDPTNRSHPIRVCVEGACLCVYGVGIYTPSRA